MSRRWNEYLAINVYWLGLNITSGILTPVLLPYLVALFVQPETKNTHLATIRVFGLAVAMFVQPLSGMLSDRSTHPLGRRRPFIIGGTLFDIVFLLLIGASPLFLDSPLDQLFKPLLNVSTAYLVLLGGIVLLQVSINFAQGALLGLIPDLVPVAQRGRASGVKATMELLPIFVVILIGPLVDAGEIWWTVLVIMLSLLITMTITVVWVPEEPLDQKPEEGIFRRVMRLVCLVLIFVLTSQAAVWLVRYTATQLEQRAAHLGWQITIVGLAGLAGMIGSIFLGVYVGAWVGIGNQAHSKSSFIWWVINRLLYLAAVGSIQGFALFFLSDVMNIPRAATMTTLLIAAVAAFLIPSALGGGVIADRVGYKRLVGLSGLIAAVGTFLLLIAQSFPLVLISGCIIGLGTGIFYATSWALGTHLAPPQEAGRYLGIANLAGAGAGIVGAGIGGPLADFFNGIQPGIGYLVIFGIYGVLFLLSTATLRWVETPLPGAL